MRRENTDTAVKTIPQIPGPESRSQQRPRAPRWMRPGELVIEVTGPDGFPHPVTVQFRDGSVSGIGFISRRPLLPPTQFAIVVRHPKRGNVLLNYQVVRCDQQKRNCYEIGARLVR